MVVRFSLFRVGHIDLGAEVTMSLFRVLILLKGELTIINMRGKTVANVYEDGYKNYNNVFFSIINFIMYSIEVVRYIVYLHNYMQSALGNSETQMSTSLGFPGGAVVENLPANAGDTGSSPGLGRSHMPRSD